MPEYQVEKEPQERVVEIGEWFNPFANYHVTPYDHKGENLSIKTFSFIVSQIGEFFVRTYWDR